jgi:multiple sugar transport system permease protein
VIVLLLYQRAFQAFQMGYASAMAWVLFAMIFVVSLLQFRLLRRFNYYEA